MLGLYGSTPQKKEFTTAEPKQVSHPISVDSDSGSANTSSSAVSSAALPPSSPSARSWISSLSRPTSPQKDSSTFEARELASSEGNVISAAGIHTSKSCSAVSNELFAVSGRPAYVSPSSRGSVSTSLTFPFSSVKASRPIRELEDEASQLILNAHERTNSGQPAQTAPTPPLLRAPDSWNSGSFGKMMMNSLSVLSLSRTSTREDEKDKDKESRGRSMFKDKQLRSSSVVVADATPEASRSRSRARSQSPFSFKRFRPRDPSPGSPQPLRMGSDGESFENVTSVVRPRTAFADDPESGDELVGLDMDGETDDEGWSDDDWLDPVTERNTEKNAAIAPVPSSEGYGGFTGMEGDMDLDADVDPDPTGEGVNVVIPPEPYFPSTLNSYSSGTGGSSVRGKRNPRRRKSNRHEPLQLVTSRPIFQRDRCTITISQGDPEGKLGDRRRRRYLVASDMSEESRYALEWGIGTVLRDGDEMMIVTVVENEGKGEL
jgi:hypothetical protein